TGASNADWRAPVNGIERSDRSLPGTAHNDLELLELDAPLDCYVFDPEALASDMALDRAALTPSRRCSHADSPAYDLHAASQVETEDVGSGVNVPDHESPPTPDALELAAGGSVEQEHAVGRGDSRVSDSARDVTREYEQTEFWSEVVSLHRVIA